jgi:hypothetical protein
VTTPATGAKATVSVPVVVSQPDNSQKGKGKGNSKVDSKGKSKGEKHGSENVSVPNADSVPIAVGDANAAIDGGSSRMRSLLVEARKRIIQLEAALAARNVMQLSMEERLARMQSSHSSEDPLCKDKIDVSPR